MNLATRAIEKINKSNGKANCMLAFYGITIPISERNIDYNLTGFERTSAEYIVINSAKKYGINLRKVNSKEECLGKRHTEFVYYRTGLKWPYPTYDYHFFIYEKDGSSYHKPDWESPAKEITEAEHAEYDDCNRIFFVVEEVI